MPIKSCAPYARQLLQEANRPAACWRLYLAAQHPEIAGILTYAPALRLNRRRGDLLSIYLFAPFIPYVPKFNVRRPNPYTDPLWQGYHVNPLKGTLQLLRLQKQVTAILGKIHQPVLIVQGRLDLTVHPGVPDQIAQAVSSPVKEIVWFEHSTHCVVLDQEFDQVAEVTLQFYKPHPPARTRTRLPHCSSLIAPRRSAWRVPCAGTTPSASISISSA